MWFKFPIQVIYWLDMVKSYYLWKTFMCFNKVFIHLDGKISYDFWTQTGNSSHSACQV